MKNKSNLDEAYYLVRKDTSEVVDENNSDEMFVKVRAGDVIIRKDGLENKIKCSPVDMHYGKTNLDELWNIAIKYPIFFKMLEYLQYQSGKVVFPNGKEINRKNLIKLSGFSKNTVDKQIKELINDDIIKSVKNGRSVIYYVNPYIAHIGSTVHDPLLEMFNGSIYKKTCRKKINGDKE